MFISLSSTRQRNHSAFISPTSLAPTERKERDSDKQSPTQDSVGVALGVVDMFLFPMVSLMLACILFGLNHLKVQSFRNKSYEEAAVFVKTFC